LYGIIKNPRLKKSVIIQNIEDGGIKSPDFLSIVKASRIAWAKRLLSPDNAKWKCIIENVIHPLSIEHLFQTNLRDVDISAIPITFYREILKAWYELKQEPNTPEQYLEEIIWDNKFIQAPFRSPKTKKIQPIMDINLYKAGILRVKDMLNDRGETLDYSSFIRKYNIKCNVLNFYKITKAIPKVWLDALNRYYTCKPNKQTEQYQYSIMCDGNIRDLLTTSTKHIYNAYVKINYEKPTAVAKWEENYCLYDDWKQIFKLPYSCTRETQLQAFQYRILHRFLTCNKWLNDRSLVDSNMCNYCDNIDTIEHYIFECANVKQFWSKLENWWNDTSKHKAILTLKHVIFGLYYDINHFANINYIILLAKFYIYRQRYAEKDINLNHFIIILKSRLTIERMICENNNTLTTFDKKWSEIWEAVTLI
jgi:hypothetical protein